MPTLDKDNDNNSACTLAVICSVKNCDHFTFRRNDSCPAIDDIMCKAVTLCAPDRELNLKRILIEALDKGNSKVGASDKAKSIVARQLNNVNKQHEPL